MKQLKVKGEARIKDKEKVNIIFKINIQKLEIATCVNMREKKQLYVLFILIEDRMEDIKMKQNEGCVEME